MAPNSNCPVIIIGDPSPDPTVLTQNVHVSSFTILGERQDQQYEGWGGDPIRKEHSVRNNGICVRFARSIVIDNMDISGCRSGGIVTERKCSNIYIINSKTHNNHFDGAAFYETSNTFVGNCHMLENDYAGVSLYLGVTGVYMANLTVMNNGREAFFIRNSTANVFNRVFVRGNDGYGIFLAKSELPNSEAVGNVFSNFVFGGRNGGYVKVNDPECTDNILVNPSYTGEKFASIDK